jgi:hypothetical protein
MHLLYHEVFEKFQTAKTEAEKIQILRNFAMSRGGSRLPEFLNAAFNPAVKFDITRIPNYKPSPLPEGLNDTYLHQELAKIHLFIENHPRRAAKLTEKKEQSILTQILSYLHKDEAAILVALLQKSVSSQVRGLTASVAKEAFPTLPFEVPTNIPQKKKKSKVTRSDAAQTV